MMKRNVFYSILTSYNSTVFCYLQKIDGRNILFLSRTYTWRQISPMYVFAWMAQASGSLPATSFQLPKAIDLSCVRSVEEHWTSAGFKKSGPNIKYVELPFNPASSGISNLGLWFPVQNGTNLRADRNCQTANP